MIAQPNKKALLDQFGVTDDPNAQNSDQPIDGGIGALPQPPASLAGAPEAGVPSPESPVAPTTPLTHQYAGNIQGAFNADKLKWDDPNFAKYATHPKYQFADMARDYADTPAGLEQMSHDPRFSKANFSYLGKDKIRMPNGSVIDVGPGFSEGGGHGYNWNPISGPDAAETIAADAHRGGGMNSLFGGSSISPLLQGNAQDQIQQALAALTQQSPNLAALLQQLGR